MRLAVLPIALLLAVGPSWVACDAQPAAPVANVVTVTLSSFAFTPSMVRLKTGVPVELRLANQSSGGHDFSAPGFFAASDYPSGSPAPARGVIEVPGEQTVAIVLTPRVTGSYKLTCTHFLHSLFGMTGSIEVVP